MAVILKLDSKALFNLIFVRVKMIILKHWNDCATTSFRFDFIR